MQLEEIRRSIRSGQPHPVEPEQLVATARFLASCEEFRFLLLQHLTCVRSKGEWRILYWLRGQGARGELLPQTLTLEVDVSDDARVPSVQAVWPGGAQHEKEIAVRSGLEFSA